MEESKDDADVVYEILLRLPVKTLKRFQCACKSWYSLISSAQFQKDHFRLAQQTPPSLLTLHSEVRMFNTRDPDEESTLCFSSHVSNNEGTLTLVNNFSKTSPMRYFQPFMQSCLGLVCVFQCHHIQPILICNPSTEELISLPPTGQFNCCFGFGYAASAQEFKVVSIPFSGSGAQRHCQVFTLGTSHWREATAPPYIVFRGPAPFLHGALHFIPCIFEGGVHETDYIAAFDIDTEKYRKGISLPAYYHDLGDCKGRGILGTGNFIHLTKLGGSLCLTFKFWEIKCHLELWLLKDYNSAEWVKGHTIDVSAVSAVYASPCPYFWAYPTDNMGDDILLECSDRTGDKVLSYDPHDGMVKVLKDNVWAATFYMESFYPLGKVKEMIWRM